MIWDKRPGKAVGVGFYEKTAKALYKAIPVIIVQKDIGAFNATNDDVL
jgi:hypothetical protein